MLVAILKTRILDDTKQAREHRRSSELQGNPLTHPNAARARHNLAIYI